ncbi:hypothetical protein [Streptomyces maremycinicus]|uniref:hypothetical protein n=1 Tax=Streptomyces maremycinicus TaxID=1679753 RepID=UPI000AE240A7|nr:hypothetical protein [Streptomyces sp. NBRC 110468]
MFRESCTSPPARRDFRRLAHLMGADEDNYARGTVQAHQTEQHLHGQYTGSVRRTTAEIVILSVGAGSGYADDALLIIGV